MKYKTTQHTTVFVDPEMAETVYKYLTEKFSYLEWEWASDCEIETSEEVTVYYDREVRYTKNGDGNPAMWGVEDGFDEMWLECEIKENTGIDVSVKCEIK